MTKWVDVVAGVLLAPNGDFFLSSRPQGKPYAGYWEFPGGKLEAGETPYQALVRELDEELGLTVEEATPWLTQHFHYEHASVRLSFWRVTRWQGQPQAREGQTWAWQPAAGALNVAPVLPANTPVFRALSLPATLALTCAGETGAAAILARIGADPAAFPLVVVREPGWADVDRVQLAHEIRALIAGSGGRVLLAGATTPVSGLDGVHLTAAQLMAQDTRPAADWAGASVHRQEELEQAARLGLDYVMLGHVMPTPSHPGVPPLGWSRFAGLAGGRWPMPVYALGGMQPQDMQAAQAHGAHGIAMMRGAWQ